MRTNLSLRTAVRGLTLGLCLAAMAIPSASGQEKKFPYEAIVDLDAEYVRCGPGPKYYPTDKLGRGQTVTVIRHDPGGWAMIAPPPESFSWIDAAYVQRLENNRGTLTANNVIVHVGSKLGDERSVYQRTLSKNDAVEILGEAKVETERGPKPMYRIKPPPREYRWIATKALVAASAFKGGPAGAPIKPTAPLPNIRGPIALETELPSQPGDDPFAPAIPVSAGPQLTQPPIVAQPVSEGPSLGGGATETKTATPGASQVDPLRARFYEIDHRMREMLKRDPLEWNIPGIEREFTELSREPIPPNLQSLIQTRLRQLQKHAKMQRDFLELHQLTTVTRQRDAQLISLQRQTEEQLRALENGTVPTAPSPTPTPRPAVPTPTPIPVKQVTPARPGNPPTGPLVNVPGAAPRQPIPTPTPRPAPTAAPKFDGAGIVQKRNDEGKPPYAIVAPDGRLLAYLQAPPELDLSAFVDFAMGVTGARAFDESLKADVIQVQGLQPVQLQQ